MADARDQVELYFASRDYGRAKSYRGNFGGAGAFGSYEDAAADPRIHALYICTPHHLHLEHARIAASAKKHILLEKPIARTIDKARAIISAADHAAAIRIGSIGLGSPHLYKDGAMSIKGELTKVNLYDINDSDAIRTGIVEPALVLYREGGHD